MSKEAMFSYETLKQRGKPEGLETNRFSLPSKKKKILAVSTGILKGRGNKNHCPQIVKQYPYQEKIRIGFVSMLCRLLVQITTNFIFPRKKKGSSK